MYTKSTMKWYRLAKDDTGVERYVRSVQGQKSVRLLFRPRTGSSELLEDRKRFRMVSDKRCVMCGDIGVGKDVAHWWVVGNWREIGWCCLMIVVELWAPEWLDKFWRVDEDGKVALLLGKGVTGICNRVVEDVGECVLYWLGRWWQRKKQLLYR